MIDYSIAAIPTVYKGQTFRSRLEAKWAAFFDLLEWEWVYEPFDFGGWSPDFAIRAPGASNTHKIVLAEVKPIMELDEKVACKMYENCPSHPFVVPARDGKTGEEIEIVKRIPDYGLLLLGLSPTEMLLGWFYEPGYDAFDRATFGLWQLGNKLKYGYCSENGVWADQLSGAYDKGIAFSRVRDMPGTITALWGQACATVQWQPSYRHSRRVRKG